MLQKLKLLGRIALDVVKHLDLLLDHRLLFDGNLGGPVMIGVPLIVPHVPLQFGLDVFTLLLFFSEVLVLLFLLVQVALIVAACCAAMLFPIAHADPAELMATSHTSHVVATLVLLDVFLTFGAWLGVCRYPIDVLRLSTSFLHPLLGHGTLTGFMWELATQEAKVSATVARDFIEHPRLVNPLH